jgi:hypothetical protein
MRLDQRDRTEDSRVVPSLNRQEASGSHGKKERNPVTGGAPVGEG